MSFRNPLCCQIVSRGETNADVLNNYRDDRGYNAVHIAVFNGHIDCLNYLVECGADINKDNRGSTPLRIAILANYSESMKILIQCGANIRKDSFGNTPLHYACSFNMKESIKYLIYSGANIYDGNNEGRTPIDMSNPETLRDYVLKCYEECQAFDIKDPGFE
jgi:ankyrin repeat protein